MAADRQDQTPIQEILVNIQEDGRANARWGIQGIGGFSKDIGVLGGIDAMTVLRQILGSDADTTQAALAVSPQASVKFSFSSARVEDYGVLSWDPLGKMPGCFISMDNALDFTTKSGKIGKLVFWVDGAIVSAVASDVGLQRTEPVRASKPPTPGRL